MDPALIARIPLFASLPTGEIEHLARSLRLVEFPANTVIFHEGEPGDRLFMVISGQIDVVKALGTPEERVLAIAEDGDFLGEMSLLYPDRLRSAAGRTRTPVQLVEMTQADFDALLHRQPELMIKMLVEMSLRLRHSENMTIRDLQEKNRQLTEALQALRAAQQQLLEKERLEHELRVARKIQESILPKNVPTLAGWDVSAYWLPARAVSGDFYDFIHRPDEKWVFIVGDVTDKGVPAALVMATTRSVIQAEAQHSYNPGELLAQVNNLVHPDMTTGMFVTCFCAVLDPQSGRIRFANAGHNLPFQRSTEGLIELRARGMPLGLFPNMEYEEGETTLQPGDSLLLYSDGLVEAHNAQGEMFHTSRLRELLLSHPGDATLIPYLLSEQARFTGPAREQEDDITLVNLKRLPEA